MKLTRCIYVVLLICVVACAAQNSPPSSQTRSGGADGGGGDFPQSTIDDVKTAVKEMRMTWLPHAFHNLKVAQAQIHDPYVQRVLDVFFESSSDSKGVDPIFVDIQKTPIEYNETAACTDIEGRSHAAGVTARERGSPVCLSLPLLVAIPKEDLKFQLLGLLAHEFVHHFGFGEQEAVQMQTFMIHHATDLVGFTKNLHLSLTSFHVAGLKEAYSELFFVNGQIKLSSELSEDEKNSPRCTFGISYDRIAWNSRSKTKVFPELVFPAQEIELFPGSVSADISPGRESKITLIQFAINSVWTGAHYDPLGVKLKLPNGEDTDSVVTSLTCFGPSLHTADLITIFGGYGGLRYFLN